MRFLFLILLSAVPCIAHTVDYQVDGAQAVVVTIRLGEEEASYSEYEIFSPGGGETPFQLGRTDARGRVVFVPDQAGKWTVKVAADSQHGLHGKEIEVEVDQTMIARIDSRPLVSTHTRLVVGVSLLLGLFGLIGMWRSRKK